MSTMDEILQLFKRRFIDNIFVAVGATVITRNDQPQIIEASSINFWNQGTTEVVINNMWRLAPATKDPVTGKFVGGEAFSWSDPQGRQVRGEYTFSFSADTGTSGYPVLNKLVINTMKHIN